MKNNKQTIKKTFQSMIDLYENHLGWCKEAFARTRNGIECDFDDPQATCVCMLGALTRVIDKKRLTFRQKDDLVSCVTTAFRQKIGTFMHTFNDNHCSSKRQALSTLKLIVRSFDEGDEIISGKRYEAARFNHTNQRL